ncbi:hypothetical protein [Cupriavidus sp.]|uniref:hypothetical protein n=1 Tax=Cupriavidus sp. TaxID=1873897 RepID=UPI0028BF0DD8|nr:hypothetical protein [Cupriavidus sp.]
MSNVVLKQFRFAVVPRAYRDVVWLYADSANDDDHTAYLSITTIAATLGITREAAITQRAKAIKAGVLVDTGDYQGREKVYRVVLPPVEELDEQYQARKAALLRGKRKPVKDFGGDGSGALDPSPNANGSGALHPSEAKDFGGGSSSGAAMGQVEGVPMGQVDSCYGSSGLELKPNEPIMNPAAPLAPEPMTPSALETMEPERTGCEHEAAPPAAGSMKKKTNEGMTSKRKRRCNPITMEATTMKHITKHLAVPRPRDAGPGIARAVPAPVGDTDPLSRGVLVTLTPEALAEVAKRYDVPARQPNESHARYASRVELAAKTARTSARHSQS